MLLRSLGVKTTGTGTKDLTRGVFGGALISTDNTNAAVVQIRKGNSAGEVIYDLSTKTAGFHAWGPIEADEIIYYSISGTGASAQLFEYAP